MNAIEISHIYKHYNGFSLSDINLTVPSGCILGLVGENGAGKSTLINLITNSVSRDGGIIKVMGADCEGAEFERMKDDIGVVYDSARFQPMFSTEKISKIMSLIYKNWDKAQFSAYIDKFNLPAHKRIKDYSRGMLMKLQMAVALSHNAKLLLLDEATGGLDPMAREEILQLINDFTLDETHTVLISSHIVTDLEKICDYVAFIHNGKLLFCDEKDRLMDKYAIIKIPKQNLNSLSDDAVKGVKKTPYGVEALVLREQIPDTFRTEYTTLEDIVLFLAKESD